MTIKELTNRINERGVKVDVNLLKSEILRAAYDLDFISSYLEKKVSSVLSIPINKVNLNSAKTMVNFFYGYHQLPVIKKTASGKAPSLDSDTLSPFASIIPDVDKYIQYRSISKKLCILNALQKEIVYGDEIHTNFNCDGTITGRFTSTSPNLQQIPEEYRKLFIARKGFVFLCCDIHQAEPSLALQLAGQEVSVSVYNDIARILDSSIEQAKLFYIGVTYGMTEFGISKLCGCSLSAARNYLKLWKTNNAKLSSYIDKIVEEAERTGSVSIYDGSLSVNDNFAAKSNSSYRSNRPFNIHVQGSMAKLLKIAMLNIQSLLDEKSPNSMIVLTEHDELVIELSQNSMDLVPQIVSMLENIDGFKFSVKNQVQRFWIK